GFPPFERIDPCALSLYLAALSFSCVWRVASEKFQRAVVGAGYAAGHCTSGQQTSAFGGIVCPGVPDHAAPHLQICCPSAAHPPHGNLCQFAADQKRQNPASFQRRTGQDGAVQLQSAYGSKSWTDAANAAGPAHWRG